MATGWGVSGRETELDRLGNKGPWRESEGTGDTEVSGSRGTGACWSIEGFLRSSCG